MVWKTYSLYFLTLFVATIIPGPSMLLALNHGILYGTRRAVATGSGNLTANLIMAFISFIGLGAVLIASGTAFNIIKWTGAAYLVYTGIRTWFAPAIHIDDKFESRDTLIRENKSLRKMFFEGFLIAAGNPKGIIFFTALFPQFIDIQSASISQFTIFFSTLAFIAFGCFMLYAYFGDRITGFFRITTPGKIMNRMIGGTFIGSGIAVICSER